MTITYWVPTVGAAQAPLSPALGGVGAQLPWTGADDGFAGVNSDYATESGGGLMVAGTLYLQRLLIRQATTITNLWYGLSAPGVGASTGSFAGLYAQSGTLLSGSADIVSQLTSGTNGFKQCALTTPQALAAGTFVWAAVLCNLATTQATLIRQLNSANPGGTVPNAAATNLRFASQAAVGTALPAPLVPGSNLQTAFTFVVGWT